MLLIGCTAPRQVDEPSRPDSEQQGHGTVQEALNQPMRGWQKKVGVVNVESLRRAYIRRDSPNMEREIKETIDSYGRKYGYSLIFRTTDPDRLRERRNNAALRDARDMTPSVLLLLNSRRRLMRYERHDVQRARAGRAISRSRLKGLRSLAEPFGVSLLGGSWGERDLVLSCEKEGAGTLDERRDIERFRSALSALQGDARVAGHFYGQRRSRIHVHDARAGTAQHMTFEIRLLGFEED